MDAHSSAQHDTHAWHMQQRRPCRRRWWRRCSSFSEMIHGARARNDAWSASVRRFRRVSIISCMAWQSAHPWSKKASTRRSVSASVGAVLKSSSTSGAGVLLWGVVAWLLKMSVRTVLKSSSKLFSWSAVLCSAMAPCSLFTFFFF